MKPFVLWSKGEKPNDALCMLNNVYIQPIVCTFYAYTK